MKKDISVKLTPFVFKQKVFIRECYEIGKDNVTMIEIPQKDLANFISSQKDVDTVYLFGNKKLVNKIQEDCLQKYNAKNISFVIE